MVEAVDDSCSWGFSDEFFNGDGMDCWVFSVDDSNDVAEADAAGDALGDEDDGFLERRPQRVVIMAMVAAMDAMKREMESAG